MQSEETLTLFYLSVIHDVPKWRHSKLIEIKYDVSTLHNMQHFVFRNILWTVLFNSFIRFPTFNQKFFFIHT